MEDRGGEPNAGPTLPDLITTLEEMDRGDTASSGAVSRGLRVPLTRLLGPLERYEHDDRLPEDVRRELALAERDGRRVLRLVNSLLDLSRLEAGRVLATFQPTDLASMTADVAGLFRSTAQAAGVELRVRCDPLGQVVYVDREMWEQVVANLCAHALELTRNGTVTVRLFRLDHAARLEVKDTGVGVDPRDLPYLFDRHRHTDSGGAGHHPLDRRTAGQLTEAGQLGTALGLALVRELVNLHGGSIEAGSVPGQGTTIAVTIPFGTAHLNPARLASTAATAPRTLLSSALVDLGLLPAGRSLGAAGA